MLAYFDQASAILGSNSKKASAWRETKSRPRKCEAETGLSSRSIRFTAMLARLPLSFLPKPSSEFEFKLALTSSKCARSPKYKMRLPCPFFLRQYGDQLLDRDLITLIRDHTGVLHSLVQIDCLTTYIVRLFYASSRRVELKFVLLDLATSCPKFTQKASKINFKSYQFTCKGCQYLH